jgi:hypothetical protein
MFLRAEKHQDFASISDLAVAYHSGARGLKPCVPTEADLANIANDNKRQQESSQGYAI